MAELAEYTRSIPAARQSIVDVSDAITLGWSSTISIFIYLPF